MQVYYTPQAKEDLKHIKETILETWGDEEIAKKTLKKITQSVRNLATFPYMGIELSAITGIHTDYRYFFSEKNYIFYRIQEDRMCIIRVLNEKQDYILQLFGTNQWK